MRGRPPKPLEQRRRDGNPGKRPLPTPVVVQGRAVDVSGIPEPPDHLDQAGRDLWIGYAETLAGVGIFDLADAPALTAMVEAEREATEAYRVLQMEGHTIRGDKSSAVVHPAYKVWRDSRQTFLRYAEQFGLTPSARARLGLAGLMGRKLKQGLDLPDHPRHRGKGS